MSMSTAPIPTRPTASSSMRRARPNFPAAAAARSLALRRAAPTARPSATFRSAPAGSCRSGRFPTARNTTFPDRCWARTAGSTWLSTATTVELVVQPVAFGLYLGGRLLAQQLPPRFPHRCRLRLVRLGAQRLQCELLRGAERAGRQYRLITGQPGDPRTWGATNQGHVLKSEGQQEFGGSQRGDRRSSGESRLPPVFTTALTGFMRGVNFT